MHVLCRDAEVVRGCEYSSCRNGLGGCEIGGPTCDRCRRCRRRRTVHMQVFRKSNRPTSPSFNGVRSANCKLLFTVTRTRTIVVSCSWKLYNYKFRYIRNLSLCWSVEHVVHTTWYVEKVGLLFLSVSDDDGQNLHYIESLYTANESYRFTQQTWIGRLAFFRKTGELVICYFND